VGDRHQGQRGGQKRVEGTRLRRGRERSWRTKEGSLKGGEYLDGQERGKGEGGASKQECSKG